MVMQQRLQSHENPKTILFESLSIQLTSSVSVTTTFTTMGISQASSWGPFNWVGPLSLTQERNSASGVEVFQSASLPFHRVRVSLPLTKYIEDLEKNSTSLVLILEPNKPRDSSSLQRTKILPNLQGVVWRDGDNDAQKGPRSTFIFLSSSVDVDMAS